MNKKISTKVAAHGLSMSLIAFLGAHATHKPGDYPSPPWPPQVHVEAAPVDSSVSSGVSVANVSSGVALTGLTMKAETGHFGLNGSAASFSLSGVPTLEE